MLISPTLAMSADVRKTVTGFADGRRIDHRVYCIAVLLVALSVVGLAQSRSANVAGVVSGSGRPLSGVHVRLSSERASGPVREAVTDASARFRFAGLAWGFYTLDFAADGWQGRQIRIELRPDSTLYVNAALSATGGEKAPHGLAVNEDVWVGTNFTNFQMKELPNGRNIWSLLQNQEPSTVTNRLEIGGTETAVPALFSAFGASWTENQYRLNGMDVTDPYIPGLPLINPDFDALAEFQVITASKPAVAQASGESLELASPLAPKKLHGEAQMFAAGGALQSNNMDARLQNFD